MKTIQELAQELFDALTTEIRGEDQTERVFLREGSPVWMRDVVLACDPDQGNLDTLYDFVNRAAGALADASEHWYAEELREAITEIEPDVYTSDLCKWLAAHPFHMGYVDEAMAEFGTFKSGFDLLEAAQKAHIEAIGFALLDQLETRVKELNAEEEKEEASE